MRNLTNLTTLLIIAVTLFVFGCSSPRDKDITKIDSLEAQVNKQAASPDTASLNQLINEYTSFVDKYPQDSVAPKYLYRAIRVTMSMNDGQRAMKLIDRSINEYNNGPRYAEVVFLKAYVYENLLGNYGKASEIYRDFIHNFPDHELADDAQVAIQNMGKTPEELIREFEARKN